MPVYIYESHLSGIYFSNREYDYDELYCDQCGDSDWLIGEASTIKEALVVLSDMININGCGGYDLRYILEQMYCFDETIDIEEAIEIVKKNSTKNEAVLLDEKGDN